MNQETIKHIVEAALLAAGRALSLKDLLGLFDAREAPGKDVFLAAIEDLRQDYSERGIDVVEIASGYRIQVRLEMTTNLTSLWQERPPRYTRALLETLALIAYRQPVTRGEIEDVRGVAVSTNIIRTLLEREWIREVGHKDVPGKPAMFGTTREFLDYFGLKSLDQLPSLVELSDLDNLSAELDFGDASAAAAPDGAEEAADDQEMVAIASIEREADAGERAQFDEDEHAAAGEAERAEVPDDETAAESDVDAMAEGDAGETADADTQSVETEDGRPVAADAG